jgi:hypothetical protein
MITIVITEVFLLITVNNFKKKFQRNVHMQIVCHLIKFQSGTLMSNITLTQQVVSDLFQYGLSGCQYNNFSSLSSICIL